MTHLLDVLDRWVITIRLQGGTSRQRSWAQEVINGAFNYKLDGVDRVPVNGRDDWLDGESRVFNFGQMVLPSAARQELARLQGVNALGESFDFNQFVSHPDTATLTFKWVADPPAPEHNDFAATTTFPGPRWEIALRNTLDDPAQPEPWTGKDFYQECIAHELGHVVTSIAELHLGHDRLVATFRELFGVSSSVPWETGPWEGRLIEAIAEFFKDMVWPTRKFDSRSNLKLPRASFEGFKDVMVDRAITAPETELQHQTRVLNLPPYFTGLSHLNALPPGPPPASDTGLIPGDYYYLYGYNASPSDGTLYFNYEDVPPTGGAYNLPAYGKWVDPGTRGGHDFAAWSAPVPGTAQQRISGPPRAGDPVIVHVLMLQGLHSDYRQSGLGYDSYRDTHMVVTAEWYLGTAPPINSSSAIAKQQLGVITSPQDAIFAVTTPSVTIPAGEVLRLCIVIAGIFPALSSDANCLPRHQVAVELPWRYEDDLIEQEPWWVDPLWPYDSLIPSEILAYPAPPGWRRRNDMRIVGA